MAGEHLNWVPHFVVQHPKSLELSTWFCFRLGYLMKTITKLLVQLEITKAHRDFKHVNAQEFRQKIDRTRLGGDLDRARSMPHQLGTWLIFFLLKFSGFKSYFNSSKVH